MGEHELVLVPPLPSSELAARILRQVAAAVSVQADLPAPQVVEAAAVAEVAARHVVPDVTGDELVATLSARDGGMQIGVGPVAPGAGRALAAALEQPALTVPTRVNGAPGARDTLIDVR